MMMDVGSRVRVKGLVEEKGKEGGVVGYEREEANLEEVERAYGCGEDEDDMCPLCLEPLTSTAADFTQSKSVVFSCCGKRLCASCKSDAKSRLTSYPLCRQAKTRDGAEFWANTLKQATRGQAWAEYNAASAYFEGRVVPKDRKVAGEWLRKAGDQGYIPACHALGECYRRGSNGVE